MSDDLQKKVQKLERQNRWYKIAMPATAAGSATAVALSAIYGQEIANAMTTTVGPAVIQTLAPASAFATSIGTNIYQGASGLLSHITANGITNIGAGAIIGGNSTIVPAYESAALMLSKIPYIGGAVATASPLVLGATGLAALGGLYVLSKSNKSMQRAVRNISDIVTGAIKTPFAVPLAAITAIGESLGYLYRKATDKEDLPQYFNVTKGLLQGSAGRMFGGILQMVSDMLYHGLSSDIPVLNQFWVDGYDRISQNGTFWWKKDTAEPNGPINQARNELYNFFQPCSMYGTQKDYLPIH